MLPGIAHTVPLTEARDLLKDQTMVGWTLRAFVAAHPPPEPSRRPADRHARIDWDHLALPLRRIYEHDPPPGTAVAVRGVPVRAAVAGQLEYGAPRMADGRWLAGRRELAASDLPMQVDALLRRWGRSLLPGRCLPARK
jgi:hypothetical protein